MNNVGEEGISEGFRLEKSKRAVPGGVGAEGLCHYASATFPSPVPIMERGIGVFYFSDWSRLQRVRRID
jgi:hypothetical protein